MVTFGAPSSDEESEESDDDDDEDDAKRLLRFLLRFREGAGFAGAMCRYDFKKELKLKQCLSRSSIT